ncbi:nucleosome assembly protein 1-like 4 [Teleopsis dalmanni]|uniref:nucleosome assembly protein 1-like 4 n=1 Tax=Teleopsis dalmanni TaxID=139649 RepID=UPI0018CE6767|nr:nucleosome assembly protein 1-like 4 [Teleopsis dalmanni]
MPKRSKLAIKSKCTTKGGPCSATFPDQKSKSFLPGLINSAERRHFLHDMVKTFPKVIQNRITVLKNAQIDQSAIDSEFYKEINDLEVKHAAKCQQFYNQRFEIIFGKIDPPKQEVKWKVAADDENKKNNYNFEEQLREYKKLSGDAIGIPNFWLTVMRNVSALAHLIEEYDEPLLRKLIDIREKCNETNGFTLEFHFEKNNYFTNEVLIKKYYLTFDPDEKMPFHHSGPRICNSQGCVINWKKDMNLTLETVKGISRDDTNEIVSMTVPRPSFFKFFDPAESMKNDMGASLIIDHNFGLLFHSRVIPKAVLYFTGEMPEFDPHSSDEDESENENLDNSDDWDKCDKLANSNVSHDSDNSDNLNEEGAAKGASRTVVDGADVVGDSLVNNECNSE